MRLLFELNKSPVGRMLAQILSSRGGGTCLCVIGVMCWFHGTATAQEMTPRAYWPAPYGTKLVGLGYGYQTGDIVTDPSLPLVGVDSTIHNGTVFYQQTISLAGRTTNVQFEVPYVDGTTKGTFEGQPASANVSGLGDVRATIAVNLVGAPSMTGEEFQAFRQNPKPIVATSLKVVAPTGEYEADKLVNVGTNRWAAKIKLGYLQPMPKKTVLELAAGVWFFEDNDEFLGTTREQQPLTALDLHLVKRFRPGFWGSIDANYYFGGRTTVGGTERADFQRNSRLGVSLVYPFKRRHAVKVSFSGGLVTESGGDYNTLVLNYFYRLE
ncbi:MAG: transporter [Betaproteobacteria bacterium]|nr:MAG: transporter [Betaproteobacteria bacterium]